jgi:hypothetical protein
MFDLLAKKGQDINQTHPTTTEGEDSSPGGGGLVPACTSVTCAPLVA